MSESAEECNCSLAAAAIWRRGRLDNSGHPWQNAAMAALFALVLASANYEHPTVLGVSLALWGVLVSARRR